MVPGFLGFLTGAVIYGLTYDKVFPQISAIANYGSVTMPDLWQVSAALIIILFTLISLLLFYVIDRTHATRKDKLAE